MLWGEKRERCRGRCYFGEARLASSSGETPEDTAADYNIVSNLPFNEPWLIAMPRQWVGQFLSGECSSTRLLAQTPAAFHANLLGPTLQKLRL